MEKKYIFFYLEVALKNSKDPYVYAFINVSHIPTLTLISIFDIDLQKDPHLLDGYLLTKARYKRNKVYIDENFGILNLNVFEYCLRQYEADSFIEIRKLYKESLME